MSYPHEHFPLSIEYTDTQERILVLSIDGIEKDRAFIILQAKVGVDPWKEYNDNPHISFDSWRSTLYLV